MMVLIVAIFLGTVVAVSFSAPEGVRSVSEDGMVLVESRAVARMDVSIIQKEEQLIPHPPALGKVYEIRVNNAPLSSPFSLTMTYDPSALSIVGEHPGGGLSILAYDSRFLAWQFLPTVVDSQKRTLTTEIPPGFSSFLWSFGFRSEGTRSSHEDVLLNELLSFPPEGSVGYTAVSSFGSEEIDYLLLDSQQDRGGCGGVFRIGTSVVPTSKEELVDGNTYRLMVFWQVADGCALGEKISSEMHSSTE